MNEVSFTDLLSDIVDNRGRTCPISEEGLALIATNCISNERLYPSYDTERRVSEETYKSWFRGHPVPGDLIFVCKGSPGRICMAPNPVDFCIAQDMVALRPDAAKVYPKYLFAALRSPLVQSRIENMHVGTLIPHFKKGDFGKLTIPVPEDYARQKGIGDLYFETSRKIEQNRRTAQALEKLARAIFRAWFVDFEPVKAKAAGATSFPSMPQSVFDALPTRIKDSNIGPVPEGWAVKPLDQCVYLTMGQSPSSEYYNESGEGLPFHQGVTRYGFRYPTHRVYSTNGSREAQPQDILVSVRAPVGRINVADRRLILGRGLAGLRHGQDRQSFLLYQLFHVFAEEDAVGEGTIYKAVTKRVLSQMPLLSPPDTFERAFDGIAKPVDAMIAESECESRKLAEMRDYLLPKLLSGQIRVRDAARAAATVA